jgi:hypothetical protein
MRKIPLSLKLGKKNSDARVERSLYCKALGFYKDAEKVYLDRSGTTEIAQYREYYPPDTTAAIFWLKNRKPKEWKDRQDVRLGPILDVDL